MFSAIIVTTCGKFTSAMNAGSNPAACAASVSAVPVRSGFCISQLSTSRISCGSVLAVVICASSESGYSATGASSWSSWSAVGGATASSARTNGTKS